MNGELAQYFALATHATVWLHDRQALAAMPEALHSTLQFVGSITFDGAPGVDIWARHLAGASVDRVWLAVPDLEPDVRRGRLAAHLGAAFAGGLQAGLLTSGSAGNRLWQARWQVGDRDAPDRRIWSVAYQSLPVAFGPQRPDPGQAAQVLDEALRRAEEFSVRHELQPWDGVFAQARRQWTGNGDAQLLYHRDLFPAGWVNNDSRRLADMAQAHGCSAAWGHGTISASPNRTCKASMSRSAVSCSPQSCGPASLP